MAIDPFGYGLDPELAKAFGSMLAAAPPDVRDALTINSGFRSPERQKQLYEAAIKKYGSEAAARKWVAPPGRSNHNRGLAADLGFASPAARAWAHENAGQYGLAFPMGHEPWHVELAKTRAGGDPAPAMGSMAPSGPAQPPQWAQQFPSTPNAATLAANPPPAPVAKPDQGGGLGNLVAAFGSLAPMLDQGSSAAPPPPPMPRQPGADLLSPLLMQYLASQRIA